jgi:hypothetical protein
MALHHSIIMSGHARGTKKQKNKISLSKTLESAAAQSQVKQSSQANTVDPKLTVDQPTHESDLIQMYNEPPPPANPTPKNDNVPTLITFVNQSVLNCLVILHLLTAIPFCRRYFTLRGKSIGQ